MSKNFKALTLVLVVFLAAGILYINKFSTQDIFPSKKSPEKLAYIFPDGTNYRLVTLDLPAIDSEGKGVIAKLFVAARTGSGRVLVDINNILFFVDTQNSIRVAERVAQNFSKINLSNVDLIYAIDTPASVIEGPSAGAGLTVATVAALENKTLNPGVLITGTINSDGTIGPVGGILAKAESAKKNGAKIFLVPGGQNSQINYKAVKSCETVGIFKYCSTDYMPEKIEFSSDLGIKIVEVSNIQDALKYFIENS